MRAVRARQRIVPGVSLAATGAPVPPSRLRAGDVPRAQAACRVADLGSGTAADRTSMRCVFRSAPTARRSTRDLHGRLGRTRLRRDDARLLRPTERTVASRIFGTTRLFGDASRRRRGQHVTLQTVAAPPRLGVDGSRRRCGSVSTGRDAAAARCRWVVMPPRPGRGISDERGGAISAATGRAQDARRLAGGGGDYTKPTRRAFRRLGIGGVVGFPTNRTFETLRNVSERDTVVVMNWGLHGRNRGSVAAKYEEIFSQATAALDRGLGGVSRARVDIFGRRRSPARRGRSRRRTGEVAATPRSGAGLSRGDRGDAASRDPGSPAGFSPRRRRSISKQRRAATRRPPSPTAATRAGRWRD